MLFKKTLCCEGSEEGLRDIIWNKQNVYSMKYISWKNYLENLKPYSCKFLWILSYFLIVYSETVLWVKKKLKKYFQETKYIEF